MGLRFEHEFAVKAPVGDVWAYLTDPYRVAPALPGAEITEKVDERTYKGTITMKVGPVSARYRGTVRFENLDVATHTAEIAASGQDVTGRGGADMKMTSRLAETTPGETGVKVVSEVNVTGILAQFGRGLMQDVSNQMLQRFTEAMRQELEKPRDDAAPSAAPSAAAAAAPPAPAAPIEVVSFGGQLLGQAALRAARNPAVWIAGVVVALLLFWLLR